MANHSLYPHTAGEINSKTRVFFWSCCGLVVSGKEYLWLYVALFSHRIRVKATLPVKKKKMAIWASDATFLHQVCNKAGIPNSGGFWAWRLLNLSHPEKLIGPMRSLIKWCPPTVKWVGLFKSLIQLRRRLQSRWRNSRAQNSSIPTNTSRIHVHLQQFSQNSYWSLAEVLKHLKGQEKSPYNWIG